MTKSKPLHGYSSALVELVNQRDPDEVSTRFAKLCISRGFPVSEVAAHYRVSRVTVYAWFKGTSRPRPSHEEMMRRSLAKYEEPSA